MYLAHKSLVEIFKPQQSRLNDSQQKLLYRVNTWKQSFVPYIVNI